MILIKEIRTDPAYSEAYVSYEFTNGLSPAQQIISQPPMQQQKMTMVLVDTVMMQEYTLEFAYGSWSMSYTRFVGENELPTEIQQIRKIPYLQDQINKLMEVMPNAIKEDI